MILRGIDFGKVWDASGIRNFDGTGWWYHLLLRLFGLSFVGITFVSKTITALAREGNMPLKADGKTPREWSPRCIHIGWRGWLYGHALNAVGLSGPGVRFALAQHWWQRQTSPFFISVMVVNDPLMTEERQLEHFVSEIQKSRLQFRARFGIQLNVSCPNVGKLDVRNFVERVHTWLDILSVLGVPIVVKISVTTDVLTAKRIAEHHACDAICVSNTVPWGALPDLIPWRKLFGTDRSPLEDRLGAGHKGGLSGAPLLPLVVDWVKEAKHTDFPKPINAGGGILCKRDAARLINAGADSIFLGSVAFLRGWRVTGIIRCALGLYESIRIHREYEPDQQAAVR